MSAEDKFLDALESVFGPEARSFSDADGPGVTPAWDSVAHLNLIMTLEAELGITFSTHEITDLRTLGKLRARVRLADG
jgi:acyl carrier protein